MDTIRTLPFSDRLWPIMLVLHPKYYRIFAAFHRNRSVNSLWSLWRALKIIFAVLPNVKINDGLLFGSHGGSTGDQITIIGYCGLLTKRLEQTKQNREIRFSSFFFLIFLTLAELKRIKNDSFKSDQI